MQQSHDPASLAEMAAFAAITEARSFTKAALRVGRDSTVLSRRLQSLEQRLGVRLLHRTTRSVSLTEAGAEFLVRVRAILASVDEAEAAASAHASGTPRGLLRLALPGTFGRMWIGPLLPHFLATFPDVRIEAEFSNRFVDLVAENFDVAVRLGALEDSRLVARKIATRRRLLCAAPSYLARRGAPEAPEALTEHACLGFSGFQTFPTWEMTDSSGRRVNVEVSGPMVCDDAEVLVEAAVQGLGLMMSTDWLVGRELADGRLVPLLEDWTLADEGAVYVVMPSARGQAAKTRAFADWIGKRFAPEPPWTSRPVSKA
ncbi:MULTISPECIES: LysR family transcriptional regulator [unclassified Mesorhizobium]|nr:MULTISPECIES: LysR family transcriptional regulator [unclassified Mesorhizobium]ESX18218.1 transcriptional regulator [Mesorhizobium sp. LSJC255A00]ESX24221.1 transcriptional regulator [Mesorhizobium sp. LSHC440B00]ESX31140.1 transcriptional regulator [Mesorhizobium sp. LSHC432A00]ESX34569.1 transcriptional regulator [Mesorhizobium sp. LSHC440A00]ESY43532.1 transcriptional regulator [Mesorhizobium sp. LNJC384A00]